MFQLQLCVSYNVNSSFIAVCFFLTDCPGFGWDRVNFHKKPGGDTAGLADPNWPDKWSIQYHVRSCWVWNGGAGRAREVSHCWGVRWASGSERELPCIFPCFECFSYQYYCCYCSLPLLFCETVLILTRKFCLFLPILLLTPLGGRGDRATA